MITSQELSTQLSERETDLARNFVACGDFEAAALVCGYASATVPSLKSRVTRKPEFMVAVHIETAKRLQSSAPLALRLIESIVKDDQAPIKVRLDAAKTLLDRAGLIAPRAKAQGDGQDRTLSEMTLDELKATQDRLEAEILNRAKAVNAQEVATPDTQATDLLG